MEKVAYAILIIVALGWLVVMIAGFIAALPWGLAGFAAIVGFGLLFIKVLRERLQTAKDDHYSKHVEK